MLHAYVTCTPSANMRTTHARRSYTYTNKTYASPTQQHSNSRTYTHSDTNTQRKRVRTPAGLCLGVVVMVVMVVVVAGVQAFIRLPTQPSTTTDRERRPQKTTERATRQRTHVIRKLLCASARRLNVTDDVQIHYVHPSATVTALCRCCRCRGVFVTLHPVCVCVCFTFTAVSYFFSNMSGYV